jgi:putative copper export protein
VLAPEVSPGDHPRVLILIALTASLVATLYLVALTLVVGTAAFDMLVWQRTNLPLGPVRTAAEGQMRAMIVTAGRWSSAALLLLCIPRAGGVSSLLDDRFPLRNRFEALVFRSEWGIGLLVMLVAASLSLAGYMILSRQRRTGHLLILLGVVLIGVGSGLQGHPADAFSKLTLAPLFDGIHAVSTGAWLGAFLLLVLSERLLEPHVASPWTDPLGAMLERYFAVSGALASAVVITGLFSAATHLTTFDDITGTQYGRLLAGKVGIVAILMSFNEFHRRHAERKARTNERPQLVHTLRWEAGLIGLTLALTALLLDATPPGVNEVRSEVFRTSPKGSIEFNDVEIER